MTLPDYARNAPSLREQFEAQYRKNLDPGVPERFRVKVISYEYKGKDDAGNGVYKLALKLDNQVQYTTRSWTGNELVTPHFRSTFTEPGMQESPDHLGARADQAELDRTKENWHVTISNMTLSPLDRQVLNRFVDRWNGSPEALDQEISRMIEQRALHSKDATLDGGDGDGGSNIDPDASLPGGGGIGFGSGFGGPSYVKPDIDVVRDFVKGALVSLVGNVPSESLEAQLVDTYMSKHRADFDKPGQKVDPAQAVKEAIRATEIYRTIHQLRPESEDERAWIASRKKAAAEGGLTTGRQEDFAITQATAGGDIPDVERAASVAQFQQSGSTRGTLLEEQIGGILQAMFSRVR